MTQYKDIHKIILTAILLESNLKIYKTSMLHEIKLQELAKIDKIIPENRKHEHELKVQKKIIESEFKKRIDRCEKYNSETLNDFLKINPKDMGLGIFVEDSHDLLSDFISIFIDTMQDVTKENPAKVEAAILKVDEKGNIFLNGNKYEIITAK